MSNEPGYRLFDEDIERRPHQPQQHVHGENAADSRRRDAAASETINKNDPGGEPQGGKREDLGQRCYGVAALPELQPPE